MMALGGKEQQQKGCAGEEFDSGRRQKSSALNSDIKTRQPKNETREPSKRSHLQ